MMDPKHEIALHEDSELDKLLLATQNTAMSVSSLSQQMGLVVNRIEEHGRAIAQIRTEIVAINQSKRVERSQALRLQKAIQGRVAYLLGIEYEGGRVADSSIATEQRYRGGFISRAYHDARSHSKLGTPYTETLKVDFDEVLKYIDSWEPEVAGGVEGYMTYLDTRREEKREKNN